MTAGSDSITSGGESRERGATTTTSSTAAASGSSWENSPKVAVVSCYNYNDYLN